MRATAVVGAGQVDDVDVVAHRGAVRRAVVGAEDLQAIVQPGRRLGDERDEVVGDPRGVRRSGADCAPTGLKYLRAMARSPYAATENRRISSAICLVLP